MCLTKETHLASLSLKVSEVKLWGPFIEKAILSINFKQVYLQPSMVCLTSKNNLILAQSCLTNSPLVASSLQGVNVWPLGLHPATTLQPSVAPADRIGFQASPPSGASGFCPYTWGQGVDRGRAQLLCGQGEVTHSHCAQGQGT